MRVIAAGLGWAVLSWGGQHLVCAGLGCIWALLRLSSAHVLKALALCCLTGGVAL